MRSKTYCLLLMLASMACSAIAADSTTPSCPTARQVIERIKKNIGVPWSGQTVDTFKAGDPDTPVTGVATTFLATYDVLQRAAASGKNLVITHEPTFYEHLERTERLGNDPVLAAKRALIEKHKLVIWRFHDHWHKRHPDMKITRMGFTCGAMGSGAQIRVLQSEQVEVLLAGESPEWETTEYVRDAMAEGKRKAVIFLGHCNSEEGGMEYCARWMKSFVPEVPVEFIPAGDPFWSPR